MANPVEFQGANTVLLGGRENVSDMHVFRNGNVCVSCWQFTPEELAKIAEDGGRVYVSVFSGQTQPPIFIGDVDAVRSVVVDYGGVWKR